MKLKRAFVSLFLVMAVVLSVFLSSCSDKIANVYSKYKEPKTYQTATELSALNGYTFVSGQDELVYMKKSEDGTQKTKYLVYDILNNKEVYAVESTSASITYDVNLRLLDGKFIVEKNENGVNFEINVYSKAGRLLFTETDDEKIEVKGAFNERAKAELVKVGSKYYNMRDKGFSAPAFDVAFKNIPDGELINHFAGKNYTFYQDDMIITYDKNLNLIDIYEIPSYAEEVSAPIFFENGKFIIQIRTPAVDQFSSEYDYVENGTKYVLETKLITPSSNSEKKVDCKYILSDISISASEAKAQGFYIETDALVVATAEILKERVNKKSIILTVSDGGSFEKFAPFGEDYVSVPVELANGYCLMVNKLGQEVILNAKGEFVAQITEGYKGCTKDYIVVGDKVYDNNLRQVTIVTKEFAVKELYSDMIGLRKADGTFYVLKDGALRQLDGTDVEFEEDYVKVEGTNYTYYNSNLKELLSCDIDLDLKYQSSTKSVCLLTGVSSGANVFYVLK